MSAVDSLPDLIASLDTERDRLATQLVAHLYADCDLTRTSANIFYATETFEGPQSFQLRIAAELIVEPGESLEAALVGFLSAALGNIGYAVRKECA